MSHPVHTLVEFVQNGQILAAFEQFYADHVVMQENGGVPTIGKEANRTREEQFVAFVVDVHENKAASVIVDGDQTVIHWNLEFTAADGKRYRYDQLAHQKWKNGQIVSERFFYNPQEGLVA